MRRYLLSSGGFRRAVSWMAVSAALVVAANPVSAWYFFVEGNGQRQQWIFGTSCNPNARPIKVVNDSRTPGTYTVPLADAKTAWNSTVASPILSASAFTATVDLGQVQAFMNNPTANEIRIVWDVDGSVLNSFGIDPNSGVLGIGIALTGMNGARPQDICAGILFLNAPVIIGSATPGPVYNAIVKHELGHVLGFAHSIAGGNGIGSAFVGPTVSAGSLNRPVMFPYLCSGACPASTVVNEDDKAAARTYYGP